MNSRQKGPGVDFFVVDTDRVSDRPSLSCNRTSTTFPVLVSTTDRWPRKVVLFREKSPLEIGAFVRTRGFVSAGRVVGCRRHRESRCLLFLGSVSPSYCPTRLLSTVLVSRRPRVLDETGGPFPFACNTTTSKDVDGRTGRVCVWE